MLIMAPFLFLACNRNLSEFCGAVEGAVAYGLADLLHGDVGLPVQVRNSPRLMNRETLKFVKLAS